MLDYASALLYVLTFGVGILLGNSKDKKVKKAIPYYILWLYVFLCFGYMTGADWRNYENEFNDWNRIFERDYGYVYTINFFHHLIDDFWIIFAAFKCLYLWSCIRLLKLLTLYWLSSLVIMIPTSLLFMLIDSPFRFMIAATFINFSFYYSIKKNYVIATISGLLSFMFHSSVLFIIIFIPLIKYHPFVRMKRITLILIYLLFVFISYSLDSIENFQLYINLFLDYYGLRTFEAYNVTKTASFFNIGILLHFLSFMLIVYTRDHVLKVIPNSKVIINMTILSCLVWRAVSVMPIASRLANPFLLFYSIYFAYLILIYYRLKLYLVLYFVIVMSKSLFDTFVYIPYSNSIPYIISGHLPYSERYNYNVKAYQERTGIAVYFEENKE
jgi:hypothetical protein